jgi:hypothetical protein
MWYGCHEPALQLLVHVTRQPGAGTGVSLHIALCGFSRRSISGSNPTGSLPHRSGLANSGSSSASSALHRQHCIVAFDTPHRQQCL